MAPIMIYASSLFDLSSFDYPEIFHSGKPVWHALDYLTSFMDTFSYPAINRDLISDGIPLSRPLIFHNGAWLNATDAQITYGDTTRGKLIVELDGIVLPGASVVMAGAVLVGQKIALGKGVLVETGAMIKSPAIIGDMSEIRQGAYLRGYCLAGKRCVLGHTTEIKHAIFLNDAKAGHFAYLGDSILGNDCNLGAGTKFANLRFLKGTISVRHGDTSIDSGRRKFGAILGDLSQTGCNSVTNPGTVFGKSCLLMPNTTAPSGYHPNQSIIR